jgi:poly(3-hydroxybutyrate) depolymerase
LPNSVAVGARSTGEAVVAIPQQSLSRLSTRGRLTPVATPPTGGQVGYLGFTTRDVGYAIVDAKGLWRTDDGAETWRQLDISTP